ncbi:MAG: hypothetical protein A3H96_07505 [Acidobacteria bacterium RIFCSPLOWO2_02_FULL_67_36]|nr:MAG: hypothetical protein A3H96_07505 [Acidobacteria bacterium RIFCSPLOWO2_02_FULL_67_36]OFW23643.1 MAG: hypothetical protein A3G21_06915 [Acidobacteria bacterium RIFCSPLOWO2_12_FULL_66_21]
MRLDLMVRKQSNNGGDQGDHTDRIQRIEELSQELTRAVESSRQLRTKALRLSADLKRRLLLKKSR